MLNNKLSAIYNNEERKEVENIAIRMKTFNSIADGI